MPTFSAPVLEDFAAAVFQSLDVPETAARRVAASLVDANLCGHDSHGLIRVVQYADALRDGRLQPRAEFAVVRQTAGVLIAEGGWGLGQVMAHQLLDRLIPRAQALGLAAGTLRHCGHIGRLGEYAEAAAAQGMALMASVNNHGFARGVAPPGGIEPRLGTNPLCIGAPTHAEPVVLDIGTSVVAEGKVRVLYNKGQQVPAGWLQDFQGKPTTDPSVLYKDPRGTILSLGGNQAYKGFGIALLLDMLVGGLSGASCSNPAAPNLSANAVFFLVLDIDQFAGKDHFLDQATQLASNVRSCPRREDVPEIILPGDPERREKEKRSRDGIQLDDGTWKQLSDLGQRQKVSLPNFIS